MSDDVPGKPPRRGDETWEDAPTAPLLAAGGSGFVPTLSPGELAAGRFRIERFLARGGMGEVYEAHDLQLDTRVALKTLRPGLALDESLLERFRREVLFARRVTHPNVCRIFDAFQHEREVDTAAGHLKERLTFLTMELLSGETLAERLRRAGPMPPAEAMPLVEQMAAGLAAAHQAGVVHRDFKSANVTLVPTAGDGVRAVITDFGLAGLRDAGTIDDVAALALGTPAYMAPEQVEGKPATAATDIYAFGIVLYEMLTGTVPFLAPTAADTAKRRLHETAPSPRTLRPELEPRFEQVLLRCLERDPAARFATVEDALASLREPAPPSPARRRRGAWVAVLLALLAVALLPWALVRRGDPLPRYRASQLTTSAGLDLFPAFSPSGRELAFSSDRTGAFEIYVRELDPQGGAQERTLTRGGLQAFQPSWSPDGEQIVFHSWARQGLWVVPAAGGEARRLTSFGSDPAWSPDGRWIVFQSENVGELAANASPARAPATLWLLPTDGGEARRLTQADAPPGGHGTPSWSPDSRRVVFGAYSRLGASIWTVATDGSGTTRVTGERGLFDPVYAPDGRQLLYVALEPGGHHVVWRVRLNDVGGADGEPEQLGSFALGTMRHLAVAADGRIAASALSLASNLWSLPLAADAVPGEPHPLTRESGRNSRPVWSPDGSRLAFERWQLGSNPDIWLMRADGSEARALTTDPAVDTVPSFTPDGRSVVFRSERGSAAALWAVPVAGGEAVRLRDLPPRADFPRLDPSGRKIAFGMARSGPHNLWLAPIDGGEPTPLTGDPVFLGVPIWSPDGQWLAAQQRRGDDTRVVLLPARGGAPRVLTLASGESWAWSFSPDGDRVAFGGLRDGVWNVYWVAVGSGEERRLTQLDSLTDYVRYPAWSPRGDAMVYELAQSAGNVWLLEPE